jgi:hypothetical protein
VFCVDINTSSGEVTITSISPDSGESPIALPNLSHESLMLREVGRAIAHEMQRAHSIQTTSQTAPQISNPQLEPVRPHVRMRSNVVKDRQYEAAG